MKRFFIVFSSFIFAFVVLMPVNAQDKLAVGAKFDDFSLTDTAGATKSFKSLQGSKGTAVIFLSAQCPVVAGYNKRIAAIAADYEAKGIKFIGINSNSTESLEWVTSNAAENYKFPVLIDKGNVIADKLGATVTPEVYFFGSDGKLLYRGAIDNSRNGENITENTLRDAFDATISGKAITVTSRNAFGCTIKRVEK